MNKEKYAEQFEFIIRSCHGSETPLNYKHDYELFLNNIDDEKGLKLLNVRLKISIQYYKMKAKDKLNETDLQKLTELETELKNNAVPSIFDQIDRIILFFKEVKEST